MSSHFRDNASPIRSPVLRMRRYETTCIFSKTVIQLSKTNPQNEVSTMAEKKEKQYVSDNARLIAEWNWEKNNELGFDPNQLTCGSGKKVWWQCEKGHEWQANIYHRSSGVGCPVCHSERNTSFPEYALLYYLQKHGIEVIHSYREQGYELDIYIPAKRIAIEYDGYFWHSNKTKKDIAKNQKCKNDDIILYRIREGLSSLNDTSIDFTIQKNQSDLPEVLRHILCKVTEIDIDVDLKKDAIAIENLRNHIEKESSILHSNPELANEWNYEKNVKLKPEYYSSNSGKKVWWKCAKGHEWQATIDSRSKGHKCPYCTGLLVIMGETDLQTVNPSLANEWNYEKNNGLTPAEVMPGKKEKVWWKCKNGHEWEASVYSRSSGCGCPYCAGNKVIKGENDLQTLNPNLSNQWNYDKNGDLLPTEVMPNSTQKVWWECSKGHEWLAVIESRNRGNGCPYCSGRYVIKGETDLQTVNFSLSKEWNYEKNNSLTPMDVSPNSHQKVWWICNKGHEWQAAISTRNRGNKCPYCANQKTLRADNDLPTTNPALVKEWNYQKNRNLQPEDFVATSHKKVWWKCDKGHEWQAEIRRRNSGQGCPYCYGRCAIEGETDLQTVNPMLAKEWNYAKNTEILPTNILPNSNKKIWWKCSNGHEWQATVNHRSHGSNCPECAKQKRKKQNT